MQYGYTESCQVTKEDQVDPSIDENEIHKKDLDSLGKKQKRRIMHSPESNVKCFNFINDYRLLKAFSIMPQLASAYDVPALTI